MTVGTADGDRCPRAACEVAEIVRDPQRVAAVRRTGLLDSPSEESFDRLTRLASRLVGAPAAFVALVDEGRDFYKSAHGFGEPIATTRQLTGLTFCHYAVAGSSPLVIADTRAHPVYSQVPAVETLGVAAYMGIPLVTSSGQAVGSFCAIDFEPHEWSELDLEVMRELAASALREIELRLALLEAESVRRRAQKAIRAREEIVGVLSHQLRDPLHSVRSSAATLLDLPIADVEQRRFLEIIRKNADAMARLVADVVTISEIDAEGLRLDASPIEPIVLLQEAAEMFAPAAVSRGLELRVGAPSDLPLVLADRSRIRQVFQRVVADAINDVPPGGQLVLRAAPRGAEVVFIVSDAAETTTEQLSPVLDRFPQASEPGSRAGLGLAIVHDIVRAHGGAVAIESTPGAGRTFSFTMPGAPGEGTR